MKSNSKRKLCDYCDNEIQGFRPYELRVLSGYNIVQSKEYLCGSDCARLHLANTRKALKKAYRKKNYKITSSKKDNILKLNVHNSEGPLEDVEPIKRNLKRKIFYGSLILFFNIGTIAGLLWSPEHFAGIAMVLIFVDTVEILQEFKQFYKKQKEGR